ncbi:hypothetical protein CONPUDRAFT_163146 [Coniophora puteana RWD-64-598 SS2]|uniref:Uncharacterized protein n=1 Tax=Coniophora puteana (strain RWD-64-598) TaxID=741705 RepID=A0A5M3MZ45_CONPW|nr:uncharacterized protein CONPUDRAFT_163146 [Coniophora puteana RWD-64-598 SS2]EIW83881.1 hypothetical protein CONPUDRAFT_163146 [Coniophora puteana RWD-64-598 SS2]
MKQTYCNSMSRDDIKNLDDTTAAELSIKFKYVLAACDQAESLCQISQRHASPIPCGYIWEAMISKLMEGEASNVRSGTTVALPRSAFVDHMKNKKWLNCASDVASQYVIYLSQHYTATKEFVEDIYERMHDQEETQELTDDEEPALTDQSLAAGVTLRTPIDVCDNPYDVQDLASTDPIDGFCDYVATLCLPNFVTSQASPNLRRAAENFALLRGGPAPRAVAYRHGVCDVAASCPQFSAAQNLFRAYVRSAGIPPETKDTVDLSVLSALPGPTDWYYELPEETLRREHIPRPPSLPSSSSTNSEDEADMDVDDSLTSLNAACSLELPLLFVNHTPPEKAISHVGAHQHRMCAASGAAFFGAAGLSNVPVFSLVTNGTQGVLTCAWAEVYDGFQRIRIAERNGVLFDLANPLSAFHFATFLVRLRREHGALLRERLDEHTMARWRERLERGEYETRWTMAHYVDEQEIQGPS